MIILSKQPFYVKAFKTILEAERNKIVGKYFSCVAFLLHFFKNNLKFAFETYILHSLLIQPTEMEAG